ncbi:hypothetical protein Bhyg_08072 [Pseudolycoriella hygida]|uniref:Uncharacterized protein n=1 Tax=Pseudolycoriella hygida TaxID=35572 RepID=A0A9Q0N567_9DIPT|nr:hypothetical protein Bhyg_08072 [Pseudolycoriella hygida]
MDRCLGNQEFNWDRKLRSTQKTSP